MLHQRLPSSQVPTGRLPLLASQKSLSFHSVMSASARTTDAPKGERCRRYSGASSVKGLLKKMVFTAWRKKCANVLFFFLPLMHRDAHCSVSPHSQRQWRLCVRRNVLPAARLLRESPTLTASLSSSVSFGSTCGAVLDGQTLFSCETGQCIREKKMIRIRRFK